MMAAKPKTGLNLPYSDATSDTHGVAANDTPLAPQPFLNLPVISSASQKLARTFQKLVGNGIKPTQPPLTPFARVWLDTLIAVGFEPDFQNRLLVHAIFERKLTLPPFIYDSDSENAITDSPEVSALNFAIKNLPELEFYLPYISLRAKIAFASQNNQKKPLSPEPDYDEDGFLIEY